MAQDAPPAQATMRTEAGSSHSIQMPDTTGQARRHPSSSSRSATLLRTLSGAFVSSLPTGLATPGQTGPSVDYLDAPSLRVDGEGLSGIDDAVLPGRRVASGAKRRRQTRGEGRGGALDVQGQQAKSAREPRAGHYVDQWPSLAYLLQENEGEGDRGQGRLADHLEQGVSSTQPTECHQTLSSKATGRQGSNQRRRDLPASPPLRKAAQSFLPLDSGSFGGASGSDPANRSLPTIVQEPESTIAGDIEQIPRNEDPLAYTNNKGLSLLDSDSESESESDESDDEDARQQHGDASLPTAIKRQSLATRLRQCVRPFAPSPFVQTVSKCVLAYFLASLFTYSPLLSNWMASLLPDRDIEDEVTISNMHFIATVAVYFNPGRSIGGMIEANVYAVVAFCYAVLLAVSSMLLAEHLHMLGAATVSNIITVVVFVGGGMALVGYAKIKVARPTLSTACSLVGVLVFTVIVKEGSSHLDRFSTDYVGQVTLVVAAGVLTSNLVCFAIWPRSACTSLQLDIQRNLRSFSTLLKVLTKTFLLDDVDDFKIRSQRLKVAIDNHHTSFVSLKKNLDEAKLEAPFDQRLRGRVANYDYVVDSLNVLAQHLGGLRTSCGLQHDIIRKKKVSAPLHRSDIHSSADEAAQGDPSVNGENNAFGSYLNSVGPHMRSLVVSSTAFILPCIMLKLWRTQFTCTRTLHSLTFAFEAKLPHIDSAAGCKQNVQQTDSFGVFADDVSNALRRFQHEQTIAIKRFYTVYSEDSLSRPSITASKDFQADEDVFLIFYFTFLLEEFAKELAKLVNAMENLRQDEKRRQGLRQQPTWRRLLSSLRLCSATPQPVGRHTHSVPYAKTLATLFHPPAPAFALSAMKKHQSNTAQTPAAITYRQRFNRAIWRAGEILRAQETKYAVKTGLGCAVLATPAFVTVSREFFKQYQLQWAMISFLVVLSPTVGQSNQMSIHRILGTFAGAGSALLAYFLFPGNNVILPLFGAIFSIPCFAYIIGKPQYATTGRFVLLTFNLTALYAYNLRKTGIEVEEIAYHRTVAVIIGVVWATILNHLVWPTEARRELARGSSELIFKLHHIYQKLVLSYASTNTRRGPGNGVSSPESGRMMGELQPLLGQAGSNHLTEVQALELNAQFQLIKLEGLLVQTKHEPRLKGPFPVDSYKKLLGCCQHVLDLLHTMNQVVSRPDWHTRVRRDFITPLDKTGLRRRMVGTVGLYFWLLASAFYLKTPLPPFFPPAEEARRAVVAAIRELPAVKRRAIHGSNEYLLYFAYALSMKDLIHQLEEIGRLAQELFGVIGDSIETWEDQFRATAEESPSVEP